MSVKSATEEAEGFLRLYGENYKTVQDHVLSVCKAAQSRLGESTIVSIYTRPHLPAAGGPFKAPQKIASKIRQWGLEPTTENFLEIHDIVGITVVVAYTDQIGRVVNDIKFRLQEIKAENIKEETHIAKNGYYATHLQTDHRVDGEILKLEIQFKTLLHNAWSKKMHDLTYKPQRALDPRLNALMVSVANTIESLEEQSRLIRDMITANWNVEADTRRIAYREVFEEMLKYSTDDVWGGEAIPAQVTELHGKIEASVDWLPSESMDSPRFIELYDAVNACCRDQMQIRFGWMLAGRMASLRNGDSLHLFFRKHANTWLSAARQLFKQGKIKPTEFRAIPLVFYVIRDIDSAIDFSDNILNDPIFKQIEPEFEISLKFNRISFIVEREYYRPIQNVELKTALFKEISDFLDSPELKNEIEKEGNKDFLSAVLDTKGLMLISFGQDLQDVRDGIRLVEKARTTVNLDGKVADAYSDLNTRLGWRRYFELELHTKSAAI